MWLAVNARLSQDEANLKSLEAAEKISFPVTTTVLKPGSWESWRSYYGQAKAVRTQDVTTFEREIGNAPLNRYAPKNEQYSADKL